MMTDVIYTMTHFISLQIFKLKMVIRRHNVYFMQTSMCYCYKNIAKLCKALRSLICHILQTKLPHFFLCISASWLDDCSQCSQIDCSRNIINKIYVKSPK